MNHEIKLIPIEQIRILNPRHRDRRKFEPIIQSIKNLGLKKPIQVSLRAIGETGEPGYDLVCGQGRIEAFIALGKKEIPATVVEISAPERLLRSLVENIARRHPSPMELIREIERLKEKGDTIQEIAAKLDVSDNTIKGLTALKRAGEERIAAALNLPVRVVKAFMNLLLNIHEEVADLLKDKNMSPRTIQLLRRVNGVRQIEIAELMVGAENYTSAYAEALLLGTPKDQLTKVVTTKKRKGFSPENIARMEQEMELLEGEFKAVEKNYGQNVLHLTLASAYIRRLLANAAVASFLKASHADICAEFEKIAATEAL